MSNERGADRDTREDETPEVVEEITPEPDQVGGTHPGEERLPAPHTERTPEDVLKIVLDGLRQNDQPHEDAGLRTAFNFASPRFRTRVGGSLEEFVRELTDPINAPLVDHDTNRRGRLEVEDGDASERVIVTGEGGDTNTYEFLVRRVESGKYEGCWMLDGVDLVYVGAAPDHQYMPMVEFDGTVLKCKEGETLRDVLLRAEGVSPHNSAAEIVNCGGSGLCGTCAIEVVEGEVSEATKQERRRMKLPPLRGVDDDQNLRLSCQCEVLSDLVVHKHEGIWGQHVEQYIAGTDEETGDPIWITDEEYLGEAEVSADELEEVVEKRERDDMELSEEATDLLEQAGDVLDDDDEDDYDDLTL
jgi:ferredoxin